MGSDFKPFPYCVTVGCWRKKSRWGRPGPAGLKDHSDPADETHSGVHSVRDLFFNGFSPSNTGLLFLFEIAA